MLALGGLGCFWWVWALRWALKWLLHDSVKVILDAYETVLGMGKLDCVLVVSQDVQDEFMGSCPLIVEEPGVFLDLVMSVEVYTCPFSIRVQKCFKSR